MKAKINHMPDFVNYPYKAPQPSHYYRVTREITTCDHHDSEVDRWSDVHNVSSGDLVTDRDMALRVYCFFLAQEDESFKAQLAEMKADNTVAKAKVSVTVYFVVFGRKGSEMHPLLGTTSRGRLKRSERVERKIWTDLELPLEPLDSPKRPNQLAFNALWGLNKL